MYVSASRQVWKTWNDCPHGYITFIEKLLLYTEDIFSIYVAHLNLRIRFDKTVECARNKQVFRRRKSNNAILNRIHTRC